MNVEINYSTNEAYLFTGYGATRWTWETIAFQRELSLKEDLKEIKPSFDKYNMVTIK